MILSRLIFLIMVVSSTGNTTNLKIDGKLHSNVNAITKYADPKITEIGSIILEKSKLSEIPPVYGRNLIDSKGDAGTSEQSLCYVGKDGTYLKFYSGEMGGPDNTILGVLISKSAPSKSKCQLSEKINSKLAFKSGLNLGYSVDDALKILGKPSKIARDLAIYLFESPPDDKGFVEMVTIVVKSKGQVIKSIEVTKVTSN